MKNFLLVWLVIISIVFGFLPQRVRADMGPKAKMELELSYNNKPLNDLGIIAVGLSCYREENLQEVIDDWNKHGQSILEVNEYDSIKNCTWRPNRFIWSNCKQRSNGSCVFTYMLPDEYRVAIYVPSLSRTFISPLIIKSGMHDYHQFDLASMSVTHMTPAAVLKTMIREVPYFSVALITTLIVELMISLIWAVRYKLPRLKFSLFVVAMNLITLPCVWFVFPKLFGSNLVGEIFALVIETMLFNYFATLDPKIRKVMTLKKCLILSLLNNGLSFAIGGFVQFSEIYDWSLTALALK